MKVNDKFKGPLAVLAGFILYMIAGFDTIWGNVSPYHVSYQYRYHPEVTANEIGLGLPLISLGTAAGLIFGPKVEKCVGLKINLIIGVTIEVLGILCMLLTFDSFMAVLLHGLLVGYGVGTLEASAMWPAWSYYDHIKGLITGILFVGYSLGATAFGLVIPTFSNPKNLP